MPGPQVDPETGIPYAPDGTASVMYAPPGGNVLLAYSRVVRLAHGAGKGTLLGTFEHSRTDGAPSHYVIRKSGDDGLTWSTLTTVSDGETGTGHPASILYQPFLFELPTQMGSYPAGTLLLTGNVLPKVGDRYQPQFQLWRSTDAGATWKFVSTYQQGETGERRGIWEPFLDVDGQGRLVCYFADERRSSTQSQILAHIVSSDGGDTWSAKLDGSTRVAPGLVLDVASNVKGDRPGMPTVATLPDGSRVMAYELCEGGLNTCEVRVKTSTDGGASWGSGPADMGTLVRTGDGRYAANSPYIAYSPKGQLLLGSMRARKVSDNSFALEDYQALFVNTQGGKGLWSWTPAPQPVPHEEVPAPCYMNYSPHLLISQTGASLRYTTASQDANNPCAERTTTANAGTLPYVSSFGGGLAGGWKTYGGCWKVAGGIYSDECGGPALGNKALAGSTGWKNYRLEGDVRIDKAGANAGFLVRLSNPSVGIDAHQGYYVGIGGSLFLGRQSYNYVGLASVPIPGGTPAGQFFHVTAEVIGCDFAMSVKRAGTADTPTKLSFTDPGCASTTGAIGVRDFEGGASFRDITVVAK
ncbi:MAG TPA: hypothetical protein VM925_21275 [Labilithrix sp.]|nr:hypothetical protein [Labilithrix sp.]